MLVDYERAWLELQGVIAEKPHHGQRDLFAEMGRIASENRIEEGLPEKALRLYGMVVTDDLLGPIRPLPAWSSPMAQTTFRRVPPDNQRPRRTHARRTHHRSAAR